MNQPPEKKTNIMTSLLWSMVLNLNPEQNKLFHRYCQLISNQYPEKQDPIKVTEEITTIWEKAIDSEHLSDCLELADYFLGPDSKESNSDRSIYFEEHLQEELEAFIRRTNQEEILLQQEQLALLEEKGYNPIDGDEDKSPRQSTTLIARVFSGFVTII